MFGFLISITHNSVFITHTSKMVGTHDGNKLWSLFGFCFQLFPVIVSITQLSDFWVISYGNRKHILTVFSFHNSIFNGISINNTTPRDPPVATFDSLSLSLFSPTFLSSFSVLPFGLSFFLFFLLAFLISIRSFFLFFPLPFCLSHLSSSFFFFPFLILDP